MTSLRKFTVGFVLGLLVSLSFGSIAVLKGSGGVAGLQSASNVAITGGSIDGTVIGGSTPAAVTGTTVNGTTITASTRFIAPSGVVGTPGFGWSGNSGFYLGSGTQIWISDGGTYSGRILSGSWGLPSATALAWESGAAGTAADLTLVRDAANTLAQKNSTNDQIFRRYGANGGYEEWGSVSELLTLSTSGTTTDTAANLLPANSYIEGVTARVTTTITTATDWKLGDATIAGRFTAAQSGAQLTSGATVVGTVHFDLTGTSGPRQTAAAKLRVTTTGTPGAGVIRITVHYRAYIPPTS